MNPRDVLNAVWELCVVDAKKPFPIDHEQFIGAVRVATIVDILEDTDFMDRLTAKLEEQGDNQE